MDELVAPPDGYTEVLPSAPRELAIVVHSLLDSNGIPCVMVGARSGLHLYTREPAHTVSVYVADDRADEARELLAADAGEPDEQGDADPG